MTIKIEQIRSPIRRPGNKRAERQRLGGKRSKGPRPSSQRATLIGLRLNRIGRIAELADTPQIRGMIAKVRHLIRVYPKLTVTFIAPGLEKPQSSHSRSTPTCCGTPLVTSSPTMDMTPEPSSTIWAIKISCTRFVTPKWHLIGLRIFGRTEAATREPRLVAALIQSLFLAIYGATIWMRTAIRMRAGGRADASSFLGCRPAVAVCQSDWAGQDAGPAMSAMPR